MYHSPQLSKSQNTITVTFEEAKQKVNEIKLKNQKAA
jgi:hypothetical protein